MVRDTEPKLDCCGNAVEEASEGAISWTTLKEYVNENSTSPVLASFLCLSG